MLSQPLTCSCSLFRHCIESLYSSVRLIRPQLLYYNTKMAQKVSRFLSNRLKMLEVELQVLNEFIEFFYRFNCTCKHCSLQAKIPPQSKAKLGLNFSSEDVSPESYLNELEYG
jgi:hypothetical protein